MPKLAGSNIKYKLEKTNLSCRYHRQVSNNEDINFIIFENDRVTHNFDYPICEPCFKKICIFCGSPLRSSRYVGVCSNCYGYDLCPCCTHIEKFTLHKIVCNRCYRTHWCNSCNKYNPKNRTLSHILKLCYDCNTKTCTKCNSRIYIKKNLNCKCLTHITKSHTPKTTKRENNKTRKLISFELEVHGDKNNAFDKQAKKLWQSAMPYAIHGDGSLRRGREFTWHPMTKKYLFSAKTHITRWLSSIKELGFYEDTGAGLHVHICREYFVNDNHQIRFMKFFYDNKDFSRFVGNRSNNWGQFEPYPDYARKLAQFEKGPAISNRGETFECRFPRSTLDPNRFWAILQYILAVQEMTENEKEPTMKTLLDHATRNKYTELKKFICASS